MAIIKLGVTVAGIRGTVGGMKFSANKFGPYATIWSMTPNPQAPLQTAQRARLAAIPQLWRALTSPQKLAWDVWAALPAQDLINSLGVTYSLPGFGWFSKINIRLLVMSRPDRQAPPTQSRPAAPTISALQFPYLPAQTAYITYPSATFNPDFDLVLEIAQSISTGRTAAPTSFQQFAVLQDPNDVQTGFAIPYYNRLGVGNPSLKGFTRLYRQTTDGLRSAAMAEAFVGSDAPDYQPAALDYDGVSVYALRGGDLSGNANGKKWSEVGWIKVDGGAGTTRILRSSTSNRWEVTLDTSNRLNFRGEDTTNVRVVTVLSHTAFAATGAWHMYAFSVDTETQIVHLVIDGVPETPHVQTIILNSTIDYVVADHTLGASIVGTLLWDGCISSLWASNEVALNFADPAILSSFLSASGQPLYLGSSGQLPTGAAPIIYFPDGNASNNLGYGGNFINQGPVFACSTAP